MRHDYDPNKSRANKIKHGIDFEEARALWLDNFGVTIPARFQGEERFGLIAAVAGAMWTAIFTMRGETVRLVSCCRSRKNEVVFYEQEKRKHHQRRRI
jgi:uncharacterized DUF497 family protein